MTQSQRTTLAGLGWILCAAALFVSLGSPSLLGWAVFAVAGIVPPLVFGALAGGPPLTVAEILRNAEDRR